jgi:hypothetical protein
MLYCVNAEPDRLGFPGFNSRYLASAPPSAEPRAPISDGALASGFFASAFALLLGESEDLVSGAVMLPDEDPYAPAEPDAPADPDSFFVSAQKIVY